MRKKLTKIRNLSLLLGLIATGAKAQLSGSYSVPGTYTSIAAVISDLNSYGISGPVTVNVAAAYTETTAVGGFTLNAIAGVSSVNQVIFQKSGAGVNPVVYAYSGGAGTPATAIQDGVWRFVGCDWVTVDGIDIVDPNTSNPSTMEFGFGFFKAGVTDGCQNNTIKNCNITLSRVNNAAGSGPAVDGSRGIEMVNATGAAHTTGLTILTAGGANSNNKFYTNTIQNCNIGIALIGFADAAPYALADVGNDVGGNSNGTGNNILNFGGGGSTSPAAGVRTLAQYGLNVSYNNINSNNGSGADHAAVLRGIFVNSAAGASAVISNNNITVRSGATTSALTAIENASGSTANNNAISITNNLITSCSYTGATSGVFTGILNSASCATLSINNNTLSGNSTAATSGTHPQISNTGGVTSVININNNNVNGFTFTGASVAGTFNGISNSGGAGTAALNIIGNNFQGITHSSVASTAYNFIINSATTLSQAINNNTFTNLVLNTTGSVIFISCSVTLPAGGIQNINGNSIVTAFNKTGAGGTVTLFTSNASSVLGTLVYNMNNSFSNITLTGATTMAGWSNTDGGSPTKTISGNLFSNWTCGTSAVTCLNVNFSNINTTVSSNTITNISGTGAITGISYGGSNTSSNHDISFNKISGLSSITTGGTVLGLSILGAAASPLTVRGNTINSLSTIGASAVTGIACAATGVTNIFKNRIYDLESNNASGTVFGINITAGATNSIYNNLVGDLRTPASSAANPLVGISLTGGTTNNIYYNTVFIAGTSTGVNFGSSAISVNTSPTSVNFRNNIFVNISAAAGTGSTVAFRASAVLSNYASTSNNNLFYAGTPGANNLIYADGTNLLQTLTAFKTLVAGKDALSVTENPVFVSTSGANLNFLNINTGIATLIESGAANISGISDDYAGTARGTFPDIGAWEGPFTPGGTDLSAPVILASGFPTGACSTVSRTYTVSLSDVSGVATGALAPVVYYKVNSGSYTGVAGTLASGNATVGVWSFNLTYVASVSDVISYYLVAQDAAAIPNLMASPSAGFSGSSVISVTTPPTTPNTYAVVNALNGVYTVGSSGTFTSLTAAANAYNNSCLTGPVTFSLIDASYSANETFPIVFQNNIDASATNSLLIRPAAGNSATIATSNATLASTIKFLNARYITFDGINSGGSALNVIQTNTTGTGHSIFWLASTAATGPGNNNIGMKNMAIAGTNTASANGVIASVDGTAPSGTGGLDNDNVTITGNTFRAMFNGILAVGTTAAVSGGLDNWLVNGNTLGPVTTGTDVIAGTGVILSNAVNVSVSNNTVRNVYSTGGSAISGITISGAINATVSANTITGITNTVNTTAAAADYGIRMLTVNGYVVSQNTVSGVYSFAHASEVTSACGILLGGSAINGTLSGNNVSRIENGDTGGWGIRGIIVSTGSSASNVKAFNNFVSDVVGYGDDITGVTYSPVGFEIGGTTGGVDLDFNTISLYGSHPGLSGGFNNAALSLKSGCSNLRIRNNIFSNTYDNSTDALDRVFSVYSEATGLGPFIALDYNDYYVGGTGNLQTLAYAGANLTTLASLQSGGFNANSINTAPTFNSSTDLHLPSSAIANQPFDNTGLPVIGITADIDAQTRNTLTPDIGADEFTSTAACVTANAGTLSTAAYTLCSNQTQALTPSGVSLGIGSIYQWQVSSTPGGPYSNVSNGTGGTTRSYVTSTLTAGTYYYILTTTCTTGPSLSASNEVSVTVRNAPNPVIVSSPSVVCGSGSATLTASGAASYTWNTGATTSSIVVTPSVSGIYNVIGSNAPCAIGVSSNFNLFFSLNPVVTAASAGTMVCSGISATLTASGANTYSWSNGATGATINPVPLIPTTYTVTGYKANGCNSSVTQSINVNPSPTVNISGSSGICTGQNASLTASGANTYLWDNGASTDSIVATPTANTTYTVTGFDLVGCSSSTTQLVTVAASLSITIAGPSTICVGQTANFTAGGAVTYSWSTGALTQTLAANPVLTTTYNVIGTSGTCSNSAVRVLTVSPNPTVTVTGNTLVCAGLPTTLTASGASTYSWNTSALTATIAPAPTNTLSYSVIGTSSVGCTGTSTVTVATNTLPVLSVTRSSTVVCLGSTATFTASGANTYTWNPAQPNTAIITVTPGGATNYTVSGTNAAGCIASATTNIATNALPNVTITPASATVCSLSQLNLLGSGAVTYTWNANNSTTNAAVSFTPSSSTVYTLVGTNANGCVNSKTIAVTTNSLPVMSFVPASATVCALSPVSFTVSGASSYFWNNNNNMTNSSTFFPSVNSTYTVTGTAASGCVSTATVAATALPLPSVIVSPSFTTVCEGSTNTYTASGAVTYTWNGNSALTGSTVSIMTPSLSSYSVVATGTNGCDGSAQFVVLTNSLPLISISPSSPTVCSLSPVQLVASGATTYTWNSGVVNDSTVVNPANPTTYTVTGTQSLTGCSNTQTVAVLTNSLPVVSISPSSPTVCVKTQVTLTAGGAVSYTWSNGSSNLNISTTPTANVSYTLTGVDAIGCVNAATVTIVTNTLPVIVITPPTMTVCSGETATFTASGANSYTWSVNSTVSPSLSVNAIFSTFYTVTGVDLNNCKSSSSATINVDPCTGIAAHAQPDNSVRVFPNPTTGQFTASFEFEGEKTVVILNSVGQVVTQVATSEMSQRFDLGGLAKGVYFVKVSSKQASGNYKIVVD